MKRLAHGIAWWVLLIAALVFIVSAARDAFGAEAPYLVRVEKDAVAYAPDGSRSEIKAGSEIDVCVTDQQIVTTPEDGPPRISHKAGIEYDTSSRVFRITEPCPERPLFGDGFE